MSWSLANANGIIDKFATNTGFKDLREVTEKDSALEDFFNEGETKNIAICRQELGQIARATKDSDVKSTALGLAKIMKGESLVSITNGDDKDDPDTEPLKENSYDDSDDETGTGV